MRWQQCHCSGLANICWGPTPHKDYTPIQEVCLWKGSGYLLAPSWKINRRLYLHKDNPISSRSLFECRLMAWLVAFHVTSHINSLGTIPATVVLCRYRSIGPIPHLLRVPLKKNPNGRVLPAKAAALVPSVCWVALLVSWMVSLRIGRQLFFF